MTKTQNTIMKTLTKINMKLENIKTKSNYNFNKNIKGTTVTIK